MCGWRYVGCLPAFAARILVAFVFVVVLASGGASARGEVPGVTVHVEGLDGDAVDSALEAVAADRDKTLGLSEESAPQTPHDNLQLFGSGVFSEHVSTFAPVTDVPVPPDYLIGPGDVLLLHLFGRADIEHRLNVDRDGKISLPGSGPMEVGGLRFAEAKDLLRTRIERSSIGERVAVTLAELRSIRVFVLGDVVSAGSYTVSGLSTVTNAVIASGGIAPNGSMRRIELRRANRLVTTLDLYALLLRGDVSGDANLEPGDVIFVPPLGDTVGVQGAVQRPAIYELRGETTAGELIGLAGGLRPDASRQHSHIERYTDDGARNLVTLDLGAKRGLGTPVRNGDLIRVSGSLQAMRDVVMLSGHVQRPGTYPWYPGMTLGELIRDPLELLPDASIDYVLIRREEGAERRVAVIDADLSQHFSKMPGDLATPSLSPRDEILVMSNKQDKSALMAPLIESLLRQGGLNAPPRVVEAVGNIRHPGTYPHTHRMRVRDLIRAAGGALEETDRHYVLIVRESHPDRRIEAHSIRLDETGLDAFLQPRDRLIVFHRLNDRMTLLQDLIERLRRQSEISELSPVVAIRGYVRAPGFYPLEPGMQIADLIRAGGGLVEDAFTLNAELTRTTVRETGATVEHIDVSLLLGSEYSLRTLKAYDQVSILRKPDEPESLTVRISGEVVHPGTYSIAEGEPLSSLLERVGGLTHEAYAFGARLSRVSARLREQSEIDRIYSENDDMLLQMMLSPTVANDERWSNSPPSHQIFGAVRSVEPPTAAGRVVIDIERLMKGGRDADIPLEHGDHLHVPTDPGTISVVGQVYRPTSHRWKRGMRAMDYVKRSGGFTELANNGHTFVIRANGEVRSLRTGWWFFRHPLSPRLRSGAMVVAPVHVARFQDLEVVTRLLGAAGNTAQVVK